MRSETPALEAQDGAREIGVLPARQLVVEGGAERQDGGDLAVHLDRAGGRRRDPADPWSKVDLPEPFRPDDADGRATFDLEADILQGPILIVEPPPAAQEDLLHLVERPPIELVGLPSAAQCIAMSRFIDTRACSATSSRMSSGMATPPRPEHPYSRRSIR